MCLFFGPWRWLDQNKTHKTSTSEPMINGVEGLHHRIDYAHVIDDRSKTIKRVHQGSHVLIRETIKDTLCEANRNANATLANQDDFRISR